MKKAGCAALGCLGMLALAAAFAGLLALDALERASAPAPEPPVPGPPAPGPPAPPPDPEAYLPRVGSLGEFGRVEEGGLYRLRYGFIDYQGRRRQVTCAIGKREHERERTTFGYVKGEPEQTAVRRLKQVVDARIAAAGIGDYFRFEIQPGTSQWKWEWQVPGWVAEPERGRAIAASEGLGAWVRQSASQTLDSLEADLYRDRGFTLKGGRLEIDYQGVADRATEPLRDCFEALEREGRGSSLRQYVGMFTAFLQELRYEVPPDYDGERYIHGFWVPTEVLVRGHGDCDSKAATFCALWRRFPARVLFLLLPKHALVGVEGTPRPGENFVRLGNRYFVLCEVAGGAKIHPGREPLSGAYEYILLEPLAGSG